MTVGYDPEISRFLAKPNPTKENPNRADIEDGLHRTAAIRNIWNDFKEGIYSEEDMRRCNIPKTIKCHMTLPEADKDDIYDWCEGKHYVPFILNLLTFVYIVNNINVKKGAKFSLFDALKAMRRRRAKYKREHDGKAPPRPLMEQICSELDIAVTNFVFHNALFNI